VWLAVYDDIDDPDALGTRTHALEIVKDPDVSVSDEHETAPE
jgi:hypothetical protein